MKKNVMMRVASLLMVCVLATTCGISGTFAKYVTADNAQDTARVAKWGVVVKTEGSLFAKTYLDKPVASANDTDDSISVQVVDFATGDQNVVAPGTEGEEGMQFTLTGTPEVDTKITIAVTYTDIKLAAGTYNGVDIDNDYYPVVFTLTNGAGTELAKGNLKTIADYLTSLSRTRVQTNVNLATIATNTDGIYKLNWAWAFDGAQTLNGSDFTAEQVDAADTALGDQTSPQNISFDITITVEQLD